MLRGCLFGAVLYGMLAAAYFAWLDTEFDPPESYIGAGIAGFVVLCCVGAMSNAVRGFRDRRLILSALQDELPRDGRKVAAVGTIHPVGQALTAPFSGEPCVICEYNLARPGDSEGEGESANSGSIYAGFLMAPSVIRTRRGEMRLLGFPVLEGVAERLCVGSESVRHAREYISRTPFEDRTGTKMVTVLSIFGDVWSDDDGNVVRNLQLCQADLDELLPAALAAGNVRSESDLASLDADDAGDDEELDDVQYSPQCAKMTEKRVAVGAQVCAIGTYDEMRRGLIPPGAAAVQIA